MLTGRKTLELNTEVLFHARPSSIDMSPVEDQLG